MKIYSAYRSNHLPNTRFVKVFENESVLAVFQDYYRLIQNARQGKDLDRDFSAEYFGTNIYGDGIWNAIEEEALQMPQDIDDLELMLENYWYNNDVNVTEDCIQVYTDDDEIDLGWYIFDERYAAAHPEQTSLWTDYAETLPTDSGTGGFEPQAECVEILPKMQGEGSLYIVLVILYDSSVLCDLPGAGVIEGIRMPELPNWLRNNNVTSEEHSMPVTLLKKIAMGLPEADLQQVLSTFAQSAFVLSQYDESSLLAKKWEEIQSEINPNELTKSVITEHFAELIMNELTGDEEYYNYCVIFDDCWASAHPQLAENLLRFGSGESL